MLKEFKEFLFRGNVIDLAVGVVIGSAFSSIVTAIVSDFLTPFISAVIRVPDFSGYFFAIGEGKFMVGHFINSLVSFILVAFSVFFFVIRPVNFLVSKSKKDVKEETKTKECSECLSIIPSLAKRCSHCGQVTN
jgi:large conductance mechanosensitive channel